jgi:hypothetical protein
MPPVPPNPDDHALVFGIRRYADVAAGWIDDLEGPDNDAAAIAAWLRDPRGGGLPRENVRVVRSAESPDPFRDGRGEPDQVRVMKALEEVAQLPGRRYEGQYAGRRLYVYVSGHGWASRRDQAAVVTADAKRSTPLNVDVTSWMDWMFEAAPFRELVLWADACATRVLPPTILGACTLRPVASPNAAKVKMFQAFAAPIGLLAVENQMLDGQWHGAFTYALLLGLQGAARTPVTSDSLRDYLHNAVTDFMSEADRRRRTVAREPAFGRTDPITFSAPDRLTFTVTVDVPPACVGKRALVADGPSSPPVAETVLTDQSWELELETGLYEVSVPQTGHAKAFKVVADGTRVGLDDG